MAGRTNKEFSIELYHKHRAYMLGLVFTVLAAAIHTGEFSHAYYQFVFEGFAWLMLAVSGFAGLISSEKAPEVYSCHHDLESVDALIDHYQNSSEPFTGEVEAAELKKMIPRIENHIKSASKAVNNSYRIHKYLLCAGIFFLMISRGMHHVEEMQSVEPQGTNEPAGLTSLRD